METTAQAESIPMFRELLARTDLSRAAVLLYGELAVMDRGDGVVITVRALSAKCGLSPFERRKGGLRMYLRKLEAAGLIRKSKPDGRALRYQVLGPRVHSQCTCETPATIATMSE